MSAAWSPHPWKDKRSNWIDHNPMAVLAETSVPGESTLTASLLDGDAGTVTFRCYGWRGQKVGDFTAISAAGEAVADADIPLSVIRHVDAVAENGQRAHWFATGLPTAPLVLLALNPDTLPFDSKDVVQLLGAGFSPTDSVRVDGANVPFTYISSRQLDTFFKDGAPIGEYGVMVEDADGNSTAELTLTVA